MPIDQDEFGRCLGSWPSGVTIVTRCCNRNSITMGLIADGKYFAVNVLAADQQEPSSGGSCSRHS